MNNYYAVCDLSEETGRVMLGTLHKDGLSLSEIHQFPNPPIQEKDGLHWDIPNIYAQTLEGLRRISRHEEPLDSLSCDSSVTDYMLFESDGSLITPTFHHRDARTAEGMKEVFAKIPWETIYDETGVQRVAGNTLCQLGAENGKRLKRASQLLPVADGFNFLLTGVPRVEMSSASATQLYNPVTQTWSNRVLSALRLRPDMFPPVVPAGTRLGAMRADIAKEIGLDSPQVISACSHEIAAAIVGLPIEYGDDWAFMRLGDVALMGTEIPRPIISEVSREWNFTNEAGYGGTTCFYKQAPGLWILEECQRFWRESDRELDSDVLIHIATSSPPFESLVNFADPRFLTPGNMPQKIQDFCKETNQPVPRKPGPIVRCVLESLALLYRRTLSEIEYLTGRKISTLYMMGGSANNLLISFVANALQIPVTIAHADAAAIGNVTVQAMAMGRIQSLDYARDIIRRSFKTETIVPHANAWDQAYNRLAQLLSTH